MITRLYPAATDLPATVGLNAARYAILKGDKEVYASAPGMLITVQERQTCREFLCYPLRRAGILVSVQWVWCREYADGRTETAWKVTRRLVVTQKDLKDAAERIVREAAGLKRGNTPQTQLCIVKIRQLIQDVIRQAQADDLEMLTGEKMPEPKGRHRKGDED